MFIKMCYKENTLTLAENIIICKKQATSTVVGNYKCENILHVNILQLELYIPGSRAYSSALNDGVDGTELGSNMTLLTINIFT